MAHLAAEDQCTKGEQSLSHEAAQLYSGTSMRGMPDASCLLTAEHWDSSCLPLLLDEASLWSGAARL